ncbi:MAG: arginase [Flavobacteriia bacterium]|nr:arginase [Flavobacteriia bacterium]
MSDKITFLINKSEITAGTRGASLGPEALLSVGRNQPDSVFSKYPVLKAKDYNHLLDKPNEHKYAKRIKGLLKVFENIEKKINFVDPSRFVIILAGDHGSAAATISAIKNKNPEKRIGVVWIDAHADIHSPYTTPSGNMHGMPLAIALSEDNLACKKNKVPQKTIDLWDNLKNFGINSPKIKPEDLVFVGVRDTEKQEDKLIKKLGITKFSVNDVNLKGELKIARLIEKKLSPCDIIYISFDVDSMDPNYTSHGTGTPVDKGLLPDDVENLINILLKNPKVICLEMVEINPCLDEKTNKMAEISYQLLESFVHTIEKRE